MSRKSLYGNLFKYSHYLKISFFTTAILFFKVYTSHIKDIDVFKIEVKVLTSSLNSRSENTHL